MRRVIVSGDIAIADRKFFSTTLLLVAEEPGRHVIGPARIEVNGRTYLQQTAGGAAFKRLTYDEYGRTNNTCLRVDGVEFLAAGVVDGKTVVRETIDPQAGMSALSGATWAGLFGLILGGPVGWLAGAAIGAGTGVVRAKIVDLGIPDEWVSWFREAVQPATVTVILLLGRYDRDAMLSELERFEGGHLVYANVGPDVIGRIRLALDDSTADDAPAADPAPTESPS